MKGGYPDVQGAPPPPLPVPPEGYPLAPYQGGPVYASPYPPATAYPAGYSSKSTSMWYSSGKSGQWADEPANLRKFTRLVFATVMTLIISLSLATLVVWLFFGIVVPDFEVASFSVSNLAISAASVIQATWTANITVTHPSSELVSDSLKALVLYKDYPLAMSAIQPTYTQAPNQRLNQINLSFKMENKTSIPEGELAAEVSKAEKAGVLVVSLRIAAGTKLIAQHGRSEETLRVFCEDLQLLISSNGDGELSEESPRRCIIFGGS